MRAKQINTHLVKHMWEAYAQRLLKSDPMLKGERHNKIRNFYVYRLKQVTKPVYQESTKILMYHQNIGFQRVPIVDYNHFRNIIEGFVRKAKLAIIQGEAIQINNCGKICAKRVERDFRKKKRKQIDWFKTRQQPMVWDEELQRHKYSRIIYFTNNDWVRIGWFKPGIKNESVYEFAPSTKSTDGTTGFKAEFSRANVKDKLLKYNYLFNEIKNYKKEEELP